jgi:hypothetical protein
VLRIPEQYLLPWLVSNAIAVALLLLAFVRPRWVRFASVAIFGWAFLVNSRIALFSPADYQGFAELAVWSAYREFIRGWFRTHTALLLLPIAVGQLVIALLLLSRSPVLRRLAVAGAIVFLLAISPLGVGSAFPFSLTYIAALLVMQRRLDAGGATRQQARTNSQARPVGA